MLLIITLLVTQCAYVYAYICRMKKYKIHYVMLLVLLLGKCRYSEKVCEGVSKIIIIIIIADRRMLLRE